MSLCPYCCSKEKKRIRESQRIGRIHPNGEVLKPYKNLLKSREGQRSGWRTVVPGVGELRNTNKRDPSAKLCWLRRLQLHYLTQGKSLAFKAAVTLLT